MAEGDSIGKIQESLEGLFPRFSEEEYRRRHEKIRRAMQEANLSSLLIYGAAKEGRQQNIRYVSNWFDAFQAYVIFPLKVAEIPGPVPRQAGLAAPFSFFPSAQMVQ